LATKRAHKIVSVAKKERAMALPDDNTCPSAADSAASLDDVDAGGMDELLPTVYEELHALAAAVLQRSRTIDPTSTTSLIQDAYVRLANRGLRFRDRYHFLRLAAQAMRRLLIDRARNATAIKRGGGRSARPLDDDIIAVDGSTDLLAVERALSELATFDRRKARIVELRFFGRLSVEETAEALGLSAATVKREWTLARAWLYREVADGNDGQRREDRRQANRPDSMPAE
jgi:RNA polymerase sigma factor (TIGR02999 family)